MASPVRCFQVTNNKGLQFTIYSKKNNYWTIEVFPDMSTVPTVTLGSKVLEYPHFFQVLPLPSGKAVRVRHSIALKNGLIPIRYPFFFFLIKLTINIASSPTERPFKNPITHNRSCCFCPSGYHLATMTNTWTELVTGFTFSQIDFVYWHHTDTTLI